MIQEHRDKIEEQVWAYPTKDEEDREDFRVFANFGYSLAENHYKDLLERMAEAMKMVLNKPYGCVYCDSGKIRDENKTHDDDCGFESIKSLLTEYEQTFKNNNDGK